MAAGPSMGVSERATLFARAVLVGERLDLRSLGEAARLAQGPMTLAVDGGGVAVLFRYGAIVFFDVSLRDADAFLDRMRPLVQQPYATPETETIEIRISPDGREGLDGGLLSLQDRAVERFQVVADVLSKSVVLAYYEQNIGKDFDRVEPFAADLERSSRSANASELLRHIGRALLMEHKMVARVAVSDKPDILWERPDLERLYTRLEDEFELVERQAALERKLDLLAETTHTALELLQQRRSLRVEWYIVALIVFEIFLSIYAMFFRGGH